MFDCAVAVPRAVSKTTVALVVVWLALMGTADSLWADTAGKDRVSALLNQSFDAFAERKWPEARKAAEEAEAATALGGFSDSEKRTVLARIRVVMGAIQVEGFHNPGEGVALFRRALREDASAKLSKTLATAEVKNAFKSALIMVRAEAGADVVAGSPPVAVAPEKETAEKDGTVVAAAQEKAVAKPKEAEEEEEEALSLDELRRRAREKKLPKAEDSAKPAAASESKKTEVATKPTTAVVASPPAEKKPEEPDLPAEIPEPLYCPNALEAPPGRTGVLRCVLKPDVKAAKVLFFYRLSGKEEFASQDVTRTPGGWLVAAVPAAAFVGKYLHYYFEAKDDQGEQVANNGSFMSPNMMLIRKGAPPLGLDAFAGMRIDGVEISEKDENPLADRIFGLPGEPPPEKRFWVSFGLGTGYGHHSAQTLEWYEYENAPGAVSVVGGFRSAGQILIAPEAGYRFTNRLSASLAVRGQFILHEGTESVMKGGPAPAAFSVMAKGIYTYPLGNRITLHGWFGLGGGEGVRLVVPSEPENVDRQRNSSDTVRVGPILTGLGIAADYGLFDAWSLRVNFPQILVALPTFGTVFDATAGAVYAF